MEILDSGNIIEVMAVVYIFFTLSLRLYKRRYGKKGKKHIKRAF